MSFFEWLLQGAVGPAAVALPVEWAWREVAESARSWLDRYRSDAEARAIMRSLTGAEISDRELDRLAILLAEPSSWQDQERDLETLVILLAAQLPPNPSRTAPQSLQAARAIAVGIGDELLARRNPEDFRRLMEARRVRAEARTSETTEQILLSLNAYVSVSEGASATRHRSITGQLTRVLERLPPAPAGRVAVLAYLETLIAALDRDPWPRQVSDTASVLTPSRIERRLRIADGAEERLADDLTDECRRLVVLGGPGSGKTWLSRRAARRVAGRALENLRDGARLDDIEIPLWTTCSSFFGFETDARTAAIAAALAELPDLGSSRVRDSLGLLFAERVGPTFLALDSLDEAQGFRAPRRRLDYAASIPGWRILLTSRPVAWSNQIEIDSRRRDEKVASIQPLSYPGDVEGMIKAWLPIEAADQLMDHLYLHPHLQEAATVPLIGALFCLAALDGEFPTRRRDLYSTVLRRLLAAPWRDDERLGTPDPGRCERELMAIALAGDQADPRTMLASWPDEIENYEIDATLTPADLASIEHIAQSVGPLRSEVRLRRFVHRTLREYLVARSIASLPDVGAIAALRPHLWFDSTYEYLGPLAVALHPDRLNVLRGLLGVDSSADLEEVVLNDPTGELGGFVLRTLAETTRDEWPKDEQGHFEDLLVALRRRTGSDHPFGVASRELQHWDFDAVLARGLLDHLQHVDGWQSAEVGRRIAHLGVTQDVRDEAVDRLVDVILSEDVGNSSEQIIGALLALGIPSGKRRLLADQLIVRLSRNPNREQVIDLIGALRAIGDPTGELPEVLSTLIHDSASIAVVLAATVHGGGLLRVDETAEELVQKLETVDDETFFQALEQLFVTLPETAVAQLVPRLRRMFLEEEDAPRAASLLALLRSLGHLADLDEIIEHGLRLLGKERAYFILGEFAALAGSNQLSAEQSARLRNVAEGLFVPGQQQITPTVRSFLELRPTFDQMDRLTTFLELQVVGDIGSFASRDAASALALAGSAEATTSFAMLLLTLIEDPTTSASEVADLWRTTSVLVDPTTAPAGLAACILGFLLERPPDAYWSATLSHAPLRVLSDAQARAVGRRLVADLASLDADDLGTVRNRWPTIFRDRSSTADLQVAIESQIEFGSEPRHLDFLIDWLTAVGPTLRSVTVGVHHGLRLPIGFLAAARAELAVDDWEQLIKRQMSAVDTEPS